MYGQATLTTTQGSLHLQQGQSEPPVGRGPAVVASYQEVSYLSYLICSSHLPPAPLFVRRVS